MRIWKGVVSVLKAKIPKETRKYQLRKTNFKGYSKTETPDAGCLVEVLGVDHDDYPVIKGSKRWEPFYTFNDEKYPQSIAMIGGQIIAFCRQLVGGGQTDLIGAVVINKDGTAYIGDYTNYRKPGETSHLPSDSNHPRSIVQFNVYHSNGNLEDAVGGRYDKKILIFPDKVSIDYHVSESGFQFTQFGKEMLIPTLKYVTVHASRLFGVDDNRVYASAYNDYTNWDVDTATDINPDNAWVSTTGANTKADSDFTAICEYGGKVIAFKRDFMYQINNNQNPFRIKDIAAVGTIDFRSVAEINETLYFIASGGVMAYAGGQVRNISRPLGIEKFTSGVAGAFRDTYYVYEEDVIYAYNTVHGLWSKIPVPLASREIVSFCSDEDALYCLASGGINQNTIYRLSDEPDTWFFETDLSMFSSFDVKRLNKISLLCTIPRGGYVKAYLMDERQAPGASGGIKVIDSIGSGKFGRQMLRALIRSGAHYNHRLKIECHGDVTIRGIEVLAVKEAQSYE
ncbi:MAG: hypothetical protein HFE78_00710 [Clostridiales bacterium]|nr:hypothetical protein [Clostridiales bacterium]